MRSSDRSNVFSHQYLSMKQNPKIKRNAMHAYITYMIYADSSHNGNQVSGLALFVWIRNIRDLPVVSP